jgi:hypothetical protein
MSNLSFCVNVESVFYKVYSGNDQTAPIEFHISLSYCVSLRSKPLEPLTMSDKWWPPFLRSNIFGMGFSKWGVGG